MTLRRIHITGGQGSGKTTLALHVAAQAQKAGGIAAMIQDLVLPRMRGAAAACYSLVAIVVAVVVGLPALRLRGLFLAVTTLAFAVTMVLAFPRRSTPTAPRGT